MVFGMLIGFIDHLQNVTTRTSNYSAIANSDPLKFATALSKSSQSAEFSPVVAW
jgi:hypothetical protein